MSRFSRGQFSLHIAPVRWTNGTRSTATLLTFLLVASSAALAQSGSPFDTGFTAIQTLFTGTIAKVASLVAIVIGGYGDRPIRRKLSLRPGRLSGDSGAKALTRSTAATNIKLRDESLQHRPERAPVASSTAGIEEATSRGPLPI